jgi:trehalose 6-phosphate synthase/phosphatase
LLTSLPGAFIEYKKSSFTFAYRMAPKDLAPTVIEELQADLQSLLASVPRIVIKQGVYVIEVRPVGVDKGEIAKGLIARYPRIGFSLAAGDEGTDEDMFAALHTNIEDGRLPGESVWTLFVNGIYGLRSCAKYMVGGVPDAIGVLAELAGVKE